MSHPANTEAIERLWEALAELDPDGVRLVGAAEDLLAVLKKCEHMAELWVKTAIAERDSTQLGIAKAHYDEIKAAIARAEGK